MMEEILIFTGVWAVIQVPVFIWSSKNSSFDGLTDYPHISHFFSWFILGIFGAIFTTLGVIETGKIGPAVLYIWNIWSLYRAFKSLIYLIKNKSDSE